MLDDEMSANATSKQKAERYTGTERILAFSDGVFAIAITLLVLDVLPSHSDNPNLLHEVASKKASYVLYVLTFLIIGIIWTNHHQMFTQIKRANHAFLLLNVVFLMWVAALPFPAALLADYLGNPKATVTDRHTATAIYTGAFVIGAILFNLLWWYSIYGRRLTGDDHDRDVVRQTTWSYYIGPVSYLIDFVLAFFNVEASLVLFFLLALYYAIAPTQAAGRLTARLQASTRRPKAAKPDAPGQ